jgi:hypothetical protein
LPQHAPRWYLVETGDVDAYGAPLARLTCGRRVNNPMVCDEMLISAGELFNATVRLHPMVCAVVRTHGGIAIEKLLDDKSEHDPAESWATVRGIIRRASTLSVISFGDQVNSFAATRFIVHGKDGDEWKQEDDDELFDLIDGPVAGKRKGTLFSLSLSLCLFSTLIIFRCSPAGRRGQQAQWQRHGRRRR